MTYREGGAPHRHWRRRESRAPLLHRSRHMNAFIRSLTATSAVFTALAVMPTLAAAQGGQDLAAMSKDSKQWVMTGRTFDLQRYSPLNQITTSNVGQLGVAWTRSTGTVRGHEGNPLVGGDGLSVHTRVP